MKPAPFKYHRAASLADATALISNLDNARLLAGGQSLMPMMNMRYVMVDHLVDLNQVTELAGIRMSGGRASIGAMTRQRDILASPDLLSVAPIFAEALQQVGHIQTRNRGTIGGSLSHTSTPPLNYRAWLPCMMLPLPCRKAAALLRSP